MLKVSLDEGYIFDIIAILIVKCSAADSFGKRVRAAVEVERIIGELNEQLGKRKVADILASQEFKQLEEDNEVTFRLVEKARNSQEGLAKSIDEANLKRYHSKSALQRNFFGTEPAEVKTQV